MKQPHRINQLTHAGQPEVSTVAGESAPNKSVIDNGDPAFTLNTPRWNRELVSEVPLLLQVSLAFA